MKKINLKLIVILMIAVLALLAVGCTATNLPTFSIEVKDGDNTLTLTNSMVKKIELVDFEASSKSKTTYYKGLKVSDVLSSITGLTNIAQIESLLVIAEDGYGEDLPPLIKENFDNAYFAVLFSEDGEEYEFLDSANGPVRLFDLTEGTQTKSIKNATTIIVNR